MSILSGCISSITECNEPITHSIFALIPRSYSPILLTVILVIIGIIIFIHYKKSSCQKYFTHDAVLTSMLMIKRSPGPAWLIIWMIISTCFGVFAPIHYHDQEDIQWISRGYNIIIIFTYSLIIPIFLFFYIELSQYAIDFFNKDNLEKLGFKRNRNFEFFAEKSYRFNILSMCLLLSVSYLGNNKTIEVLIRLCRCNKLKYWFIDHHCQMNFIGETYYGIVRGIDGYLALGMFILSLILVFALYFGLDRIDHSKHPTSQFISAHQKICIDRLIIRLAASAFFGPLVLIAHSMALRLELKPTSELLRTFVELAMPHWVFISIMNTLFLILVISWFHGRIKEAAAAAADEGRDSNLTSTTTIVNASFLVGLFSLVFQIVAVILAWQ